MTEIDFSEIAKRALKVAMVKRDITYDEFAKQLSERGLPIKTQSLSNKIHRGNFKADYFLELLWHLGERQLDLTDLVENQGRQS